MSNKFEQLLDYLVNEEMDKANELFHDIVVEKSREIYGDLIAEEAEDDQQDESREDEDMDEAREDEDMDEAREDEDMDEAREDEDMDEAREDEDMDEAREDEDMDENYGMEDESVHEIGGDKADGMLDVVKDKSAMGMGDDDSGMDMDGGEMGGSDEPATKDDIMDIKDDLAELKAEFEALLAAEKGEEEHKGQIGDFDGDGDLDVKKADGADDAESDDAESDAESENMDEQFMREYREVVGKPYSGGKVAGKTEEASTNKSAVVNADPKDRPTSTASAKNIAQSTKGEDKKAGADAKSLAGSVKGEFTKGVTTNIDGKQSGVKTLKKEPGHGAEKKGAGETSGTNTTAIVTKKQ